VESLLGKKLNHESIEAVARSAAEAVDPIDDLRGPADYKRHVVKVMVRRALMQCGGEQAVQ
jgi:carbon-monoxide dehydrogenase medium subunit